MIDDEKRFKLICEMLSSIVVGSFRSLFSLAIHVLDVVDTTPGRNIVKIDRSIDAQCIINFYSQLNPPIVTIDQASSAGMMPIDIVVIAETLTIAKKSLIDAGVVTARKIH